MAIDESRYQSLALQIDNRGTRRVNIFAIRRHRQDSTATDEQVPHANIGRGKYLRIYE
jgi:hypothetical protein